ncbi:MAG TPA: BON domain-containing protein [Casimicrobiaceae bacterium]|nr:BON domain-containing protein [Casimicrobiaceae bacterium]
MNLRLVRDCVAVAALIATAAALSSCVPVMVAGGVAAGAAIATDRRTTGAQLDDEVIEDKTSLALKERFKGDFHINVTSYNGIVLLTGEVPAESAKADVEQLVRSTPKVRAVQDELVVGPVTDLSSRSNDTLITSKVKARFVEENKFQINHVKVVTERGVVYLMGVVTREEGAAAAQIASTTEGVQRVVKVFEYVNG